MECAIERKTNWVHVFLDLIRFKVTIAVVFTTATGYFLAIDVPNFGILIPIIGVFVLAAGSTVLNQCQEAHIDAQMDRTKKRPIPSQIISKSSALFIAVVLLMLGLGILTSNAHSTTQLLLLGLFAVIWYNGVYTYLKRLTSFAVAPGAVIGAIPPMIGYVAAGGAITDPVIIFVAIFIFIWQIPHFWLLLLMFGGQYTDAGLPCLTKIFSPIQLCRITLMWVIATAVAGLGFPAIAHGYIQFPWNVLIVVFSFTLIYKTIPKLRSTKASPDRTAFKITFMYLNSYVLAVLICLMLNATFL